MNILILGNSEILLLFRYLRHFLINIDILKEYDGSDLSKYELIITDNTNLKNLENSQIRLIFNVVENLDNLSTNKNLVNLFLTFDHKNPEKDLISQFIDNPKWNFYYDSCEKSNVKLIYDLFSECKEYNKIKSNEIKFHKI
tara:strand:- start:332 stop:754 length:423 start_codon:yes stop_codon:yes gene_type:complete